MKKFFIAMGVVALSLAAMACGDNKKNDGCESAPAEVRKIDLNDYRVAKNEQMDTLSYAMGANVGLNVRFNMEDFQLNHNLYLKYALEFFENGSLEDERLMEDQQKMMEFHYTRYMPYLQAKRQREMFKTDRPDTLPLPNVPEIYNETYTKEDVTAMLGRSTGSMLLNVKEDIKINWVMEAIHDALKLESDKAIDTDLKLTQEQMNKAIMNYQRERMQREMEAHAIKMEENAAASAEWLAEIEKMENVNKTESGLLYRIDREGTGAFAKADSDVVEVNYEGKTRTGKIFDSSYERGESISFGLNQVIRGWTEGMKLVAEGGQITLWIPSDMAYGERGAGADIGPNEALEFKVELIKVNPAK